MKMNFSCQRDKLSDAVNVVSKAASVKSTITALEGIKAEIKDGKIKMSAYDFNVAISAVFDANTVENGTIIFPAKLFGDIVRKLPGGEDVYIEADESYQIKNFLRRNGFQYHGRFSRGFSGNSVCQ